jgi:hypothetical protein
MILVHAFPSALAVTCIHCRITVRLCTALYSIFTNIHYDVLRNIYGRNNWQFNVMRSRTVVTSTDSFNTYKL